MKVMGIDCRIELGNNATTDRIHKVILQIIGHQADYRVFDKKAFDITQPTSRDNPWHMRFDRSLGSPENSSVTGCVTINFQTLDNKNYSWHCSLESDNEEGKVILPGSYGFSMMVGKRLVDFFGGRVLFSDMYDWTDEIYAYTNKTPLYGKKTRSQNSDDRFYQFYNALNITEPLSEKDILWFEKRGIGMDEDGMNIVHQINVAIFHHHLEEKLDEKTTEGKRLKI